MSVLMYVGLTAAIFALFGWVVGRVAKVVDDR